MPYAHWQSSLSSPLWRWRSHWVPPEKAESETSSWSPWPSCWAPLRSLAWGHSCLLPVVLFSQPAQPCPLLNLGSRQPERWTSPSELFHSLSSCPASQSWWSTVTAVQQHCFGHGDAGRLVLGEQLTSSSITLESSLSERLPQLHPSLPSLSLSCSLRGSPSLSLYPFLS